MNDIVDIANNNYDICYKYHVEKIRYESNKVDINSPENVCLNCGQDSKYRFCDSDCRDDHEKRTRLG